MEIHARILVVDNETGVVSALKIGLERQGFQVDAFTNPVTALSHFQEGKYDLALLDVDMPEMTGFRLAQELLKVDGRLRICFLTAYGSRFEGLYKQLFPAFQSYCYLEKPQTIREITKVIFKALGR
jgi:DNA-binding response OmpR family regulator